MESFLIVSSLSRTTSENQAPDLFYRYMYIVLDLSRTTSENQAPDLFYRYMYIVLEMMRLKKTPVNYAYVAGEYPAREACWCAPP